MALGTALVLVGAVVLVGRTGWWGVLGARTGANLTCALRASQAPGGSWCPLYREDFDTPVPVGGFTNASPDDWYLAPANPYAASLRSYPDGWGTTGDLSLNLASQTAEVLDSTDGARGVFRLYGHTASVDGRDQALGGSFYPVIRPDAQGDDQVSQTYGRYTVRFRTTGGYPPAADGSYPRTTSTGRYGTAFLLWPADDHWPDGEVDYPEMAWGDRITGHVHTIGQPELTSSDFQAEQSTATWNTATIAWSPGLLVFSLNGSEVSRTTRDVPSTPMRWGFQSGGTLGTPAPDVTGELLVDWVRIEAYQPDQGVG